jgi:hypothetical protein
MMAHPTVRKAKGRNAKRGEEGNMGKGTAAATVRVLEHTKELAVAPSDSDPISDVIGSDECDIATVEADDTFDKAVNSSSDEFRKAFHGRANSHVGVNWRSGFKKGKKTHRK